MSKRSTAVQYDLPLFQELDKSSGSTENLGLTFRDSKHRPVHRWYPYVEGFASGYIESVIRDYGQGGPVFDPFGGSGTVNLIASSMGIKSLFCEASPFMRFVAETKVNARREAAKDPVAFSGRLNSLRNWLSSPKFKRQSTKQDLSDYSNAFRGRDFFSPTDLRDLLAIRAAIEDITHDKPHVRDLCRLALAAITVSCSHMTRRADLRRRRDDEYIGRVVDVGNAYLKKLAEIEADTLRCIVPFASTQFIGADSRKISKKYDDKAGLILTSPPYLNGTNYMRNTKLELWLLGFIESEDELSNLNRVCMVCGINNVIRGRSPKHSFDGVDAIGAELEAVSPDARIPELVRGYFSDMYDVFEGCRRVLKTEGHLILDIGDSKFYGVHVPTDELLVLVAERSGFQLVGAKLLARRHSRDRTPLKQVELIFRHAR